MTLSVLTTYIREARAFGLSDQDIVEDLARAGWSTTLIHAVVGTTNLPTTRVPVLETRSVNKVYNGAGEATHALREANIAIHPGESVAIVGKSGSGKSTLMHILATLDRPTSGELHVEGVSTAGLTGAQIDTLRNKKFGFVFQQFFLNGRNTCLENVILPLSIMGMSADERERRGRDILDAVGLSDKANKRAGQLSGGQKQRLCIARALVTEPEVIFADEPTGNLDSENGRAITELLFRLQRERGITLVIVTHDSDLAALCGRTITIRDGAVTL
jgi:putative ABC transport system ATP-binding protein